MHFVEQCLLAEAWDWSSSTTQIIKHGNATNVGDTALSETEPLHGGQTPKHNDDSSLAKTPPAQRGQLAYENDVAPTDKQSLPGGRDVSTAHDGRVTTPARSARSGRSDRFNFSRYYDEQSLEGFDDDKSASLVTPSGYVGYAGTRPVLPEQRINTDAAGYSTDAGLKTPRADLKMPVGRAGHAREPSHVPHVRMQPHQRGQHSYGSDIGNAASAGYHIQTDYSAHVSYSASASYSSQTGSSATNAGYNPSHVGHSVYANNTTRAGPPDPAADFGGRDNWPFSRSPAPDPELEPVPGLNTVRAVEFAPNLPSPTGPGTFSRALPLWCLPTLTIAEVECRDDISEAETIWPIVFPSSDVSGFGNAGINSARAFPPRPPTPTPWGRSGLAKQPAPVASGTKKIYGKLVEKVLVDSWAGWWWRRHVRQCSAPQHQPYLDQLMTKDREKTKSEWQKRMKARLEQISRE
jgi:hypothetical protein